MRNAEGTKRSRPRSRARPKHVLSAAERRRIAHEALGAAIGGRSVREIIEPRTDPRAVHDVAKHGFLGAERLRRQREETLARSARAHRAAPVRRHVKPMSRQEQAEVAYRAQFAGSPFEELIASSGTSLERTVRNIPRSALRTTVGFGQFLGETGIAGVAEGKHPVRLVENLGRMTKAATGSKREREKAEQELREHSPIARQIMGIAESTAYMAQRGPVIIGQDAKGQPIYRSKTGGETKDAKHAARGIMAKIAEDPVPYLLTFRGGRLAAETGLYKAGSIAEKRGMISGDKFTRGLDPGEFLYRDRHGHPIGRVRTSHRPGQRRAQEQRRRAVVGMSAQLERALGRELPIGEHARATRLAIRERRRKEAAAKVQVIAPFRQALSKISGDEAIGVILKAMGGKGAKAVRPSEWADFHLEQRQMLVDRLEAVQQKLRDLDNDPDAPREAKKFLTAEVKRITGDITDQDVMLRYLQRVPDELYDEIGEPGTKTQYALEHARSVADAGGDLLEELGLVDAEARTLRAILPARIIRGARWMEESPATRRRLDNLRDTVARYRQHLEDAQEKQGSYLGNSEAEQLQTRIAYLESLHGHAPEDFPTARKRAYARLEELNETYDELVKGIAGNLPGYLNLRRGGGGRGKRAEAREKLLRDRSGKIPTQREEALNEAEARLLDLLDKNPDAPGMPELRALIEERDRLHDTLADLDSRYTFGGGAPSRVELEQLGLVGDRAPVSKAAIRELEQLRERLPNARTDIGSGAHHWADEAQRDKALVVSHLLEEAEHRLERYERAYQRRYGQPAGEERLSGLVGGPAVEGLLEDLPDVLYFPLGGKAPRENVYQAQSGAVPPKIPGVARVNRGVNLLAARWLPHPSAWTDAYLQALGYAQAIGRGELAWQIGKPAGTRLEPGHRYVRRTSETPRRAEKERGIRHQLAAEALQEPLPDLDTWVNTRVVTKDPAELQRWVDEGTELEDIRQITDQDYRRIFGEFTPASRLVKMLVDTPTDFWRSLTLSFRPAWIVNNFIGNTILYAANHAFTSGAPGYGAAMMDEWRGRQPRLPEINHPNRDAFREYAQQFPHVDPADVDYGLEFADSLAYYSGDPRGFWDRIHAEDIAEGADVSNALYQTYRSYTEKMPMIFGRDPNTAPGYLGPTRPPGIADVHPAEIGPVFTSQLERVVDGLPDKASPAQIRGLTKDIKQEERDWTGFDKFLEGAEARGVKSLAREEVKAWLDDQAIQVTETVLEKPSAEKAARLSEIRAQLRSMEETHKQLVQRFGPRNDEIDKLNIEYERLDEERRSLQYEIEFHGDAPGRPQYSSYSTLGDTPNYRELLIQLPEDQYGGLYNTSHFAGHPNVLAHVRFNEGLVDGERTLFIEEIQSDWHQAGRKEGYKQDVTQTPEYIEAREAAIERHGEVDRLEQEMRWTGPTNARDIMNMVGSMRSIRTAYKGATFDVRPSSDIRGPNGMYDITAIKPGMTAPIEAGSRYSDWHAATTKAAQWQRWAEMSDEQLDSTITEYIQLADAYNHAQLAADRLRNMERVAARYGVADAPFKKTWHELAFKRMLRWAVDEGYQRVAWTTGKTQADRYQLGEHVAGLRVREGALDEDALMADFDRWWENAQESYWDPDMVYRQLEDEGIDPDSDAWETRYEELRDELVSEGEKEAWTSYRDEYAEDFRKPPRLDVWEHGQGLDNQPSRSINLDAHHGDLEESDLADYVGEAMAERLIDRRDELLAGDDLYMGDNSGAARGMVGFYDQMLVKFVDKYMKKDGVRVTQRRMPTKGERYEARPMNVTPEQFANARRTELGRETPPQPWEIVRHDTTTDEPVVITTSISEASARAQIEAWNEQIEANAEAVHSVDLTAETRARVLAGQRLLQMREDMPRGAVMFAEGDAILSLMQGADRTTLIHEAAHIARRYLNPEDLRVVEKDIGVRHGVWTRANEEAWAEKVQAYSLGKTSAKGMLGRALDTVKDMILNLLLAGRRRGKLSPEMEKVIDKLLPPAPKRPRYFPAELQMGFIRSESSQAGKISRGVKRIDGVRNVRDMRSALAAAADLVRSTEDSLLEFNAKLTDNVPRRAAWYRTVEKNRKFINNVLDTNYTFDELMGELENVTRHPELHETRLRELHDDLVEQVFGEMIDFSRLSETERRLFRRVFPFYSWLKGMTRALFQFTYDHPLKAAIMAIAGEYASEELEQVYGKGAEVMRGLTRPLRYVGNGEVDALGTIGFSPYATPADIGSKALGFLGMSDAPADNPFLAANPIFQVLGEAAFQTDLFGGREIPHSQARILGEQFAQSFPEVHAIESVLNPPHPTNKQGEPTLTVPGARWHGVPYEFLNYLGIPIRRKNVNAAVRIVHDKGEKLSRADKDFRDELRGSKRYAKQIGVGKVPPEIMAEMMFRRDLATAIEDRKDELRVAKLEPRERARITVDYFLRLHPDAAELVNRDFNAASRDPDFEDLARDLMNDALYELHQWDDEKNDWLEAQANG